MAYLVVYAQDGEVLRRELSGPVVIGRATECDIALLDIELSRRHCRIEPEDGQWMLIDLGSRNGTYVRGRRIHRHLLMDGDEIHLGRLRVRFHAGAFLPSRPTRPPAPATPARDEDGTIADDDTYAAMPIPRPKPISPTAEEGESPPLPDETHLSLMTGPSVPFTRPPAMPMVAPLPWPRWALGLAAIAAVVVAGLAAFLLWP